jgi:predicted GNAT family acetyltransferase
MLLGMGLALTHSPDLRRYEAQLDGELVGFAEYRLEGRRMTIFHTEVDRAHEGHGIGGRLARLALDDVVARERELVPSCPFIADYIRRHPEPYLSTVVPELRAEVLGGG